MNAFQIFTHRRPASGIHLLSDPFPIRLNTSDNTLFERAGLLSSQREFLSSTRRIPMMDFKRK